MNWPTRTASLHQVPEAGLATLTGDIDSNALRPNKALKLTWQRRAMPPPTRELLAGNGLPAQDFFQKGNGQPALSLQGGLIQAFEQLEQRTHAALASGQDKATDFIAEVQAAA